MMPEAPAGMDGAENAKPLVATCNISNIASGWQTTTSSRPDHTHAILRKELQENVNLPVNGMNRAPTQFKDAEKPVVQLYVCFFCEKNFQDKEMLQGHQKICSQRPARLLQDLGTPNKHIQVRESRPRINIANPRKNMYITSLGLLPVEKAKHVEMAHRIRRDSQIDCDSIEVDKTPAMTPRTPTTPRTPKSLISFNTPSSNKQPEVYTISSDDESDSGSSDSLMEPQDVICHAPLMTIDFSSPLGQRIKGHIKQVTKPNTNDYERFCKTPVKNRFKERLRERDSFALITFKHKRHYRKYYHTYRFSKDDNRDFMLHAETGLNRKSRKLLKRMKPCRVVLRRLSKDWVDVYKKSKVPNVCLEPLTPEQIDKWSHGTPSPDPEDLPDLSCTFPPTPVIKCYDLKSLLGATPSRLAVINKDSEEVDEHTRNRVIVYNAILADAIQDTDGESGTSQLNGKYAATRALLRPGNPNPLPTSQQTRVKLAMEGLDDDCVFSNRPASEGLPEPKSKPQPKKPEYVPQMLSSLSPDNPTSGNSTIKTSNTQQRSRAVLPNRQVPALGSRIQPQPRQMGVATRHVQSYQSNAVQSQMRQTGLSNNVRRPQGQTTVSNIATKSSPLMNNNTGARRTGRTRVIENKIDDDISILVPVGDDGVPTKTSSLGSGIKRPFTSNLSGPSSKVPRLDPGRQNVNTVQPSQVVKRLTFDNAGRTNQSKPLASIPPTRSTLNNVSKQPAWNPSINLGSRQAHNVNLANQAKPRADISTSNMATRQSNAGVNRAAVNTTNFPKLGVHENGKQEDKNFLFKCHLCGLEEQYSVNATNRIYNHLHTIHKEEVIHIVDYNTQGEVHLVEAMGQPPTMIRTSNFTKSNPVDSGGRSTPNPPPYYGISSEPTLGQGPPRTDSVSSVPSVEGAWFDTMKNKSHNNATSSANKSYNNIAASANKSYNNMASANKSYNNVTSANKGYNNVTAGVNKPYNNVTAGVNKPYSNVTGNVNKAYSNVTGNVNKAYNNVTGNVNKAYNNVTGNANRTYNNITARNVQQTQPRGKVMPQYSLRPKTPPKSYGQPTPPTTPQSCQSVLPRRSNARATFSGSKVNHSRSITIDDDDVVCLDDDVICIS